MSSKSAKVKVKTQPAVVMESEVARQIRQHARASMKTEVCGVLLGAADLDRTIIEACIAGVNAAQGGAHVTFTQDTWEHIYKIKDERFPDSRIVGWYHSHPGFGVFLSEHDLFIQENFFSNPQQVAWVYDPHSDEEGCFGWVGGKTEKLSALSFGYSQSVQASAGDREEGDEQETEPSDDRMAQSPAASARRDPAWVTWATRILMSLSLLAVGFVAGLFLWTLSPWARSSLQRLAEGLRQQDQQLLQCEPELSACQARMLRSSPRAPADPGTSTQNPQPAQPQPEAPSGAGKGGHGER